MVNITNLRIISQIEIIANVRLDCSGSDMTYIEDITRWREDMDFMFEWQEQ